MKTSRYAAGLVVSTFLGACAQARPNASPAAAPSVTSATTTTAAAVTPALTDAQIVGVMNAMVAGELARETIAVTRAKSASTKSFVDSATAYDQKDREDATSTGVGSEPSALADELTSIATRDRARLAGLGGAEFDRAYLDAEIDARVRIVDAIDRALLPNVTRDEVRRSLEALRARSLAQLQNARTTRAVLR